MLKLHGKRLRAKLFFAWYDGWLGYFYDQKKQVLYVCFIPTLPIKFWWEA